MRTSNETFTAMLQGLEQAGMTRTEVAQKLGCSRMHVWRLETGSVRRPSYVLGTKIIKLYEKRVLK